MIATFSFVWTLVFTLFSKSAKDMGIVIVYHTLMRPLSVLSGRLSRD